MENIYNWKSFLVEIMHLGLSDIQYLSILDDMPEDKKASADDADLVHFLESIERDVDESDNRRLAAQIIGSALTSYMEGMREYEAEEAEEIPLECSFAQDEQLKKKYSSWTDDDIFQWVSEYIRDCYPEFQDGFDLKLFRAAKQKFWSYNNISNRYALGWDFVEKVGLAFNHVEQDVKRRFSERVERESDIWIAEYLDWLIVNNLKCSKSSLKTYFGHMRLHIDDAVLTEVLLSAKKAIRENKERGYKNIMENIESWVLNFKEWADQKHTKYTKQSMKVFFEEMNIEVTELVLDEIKGRIGRFH